MPTAVLFWNTPEGDPIDRRLGGRLERAPEESEWIEIEGTGELVRAMIVVSVTEPDARAQVAVYVAPPTEEERALAFPVVAPLRLVDAYEIESPD